jgi:hypothetical protein
MVMRTNKKHLSKEAAATLSMTVAAGSATKKEQVVKTLSWVEDDPKLQAAKRVIRNERKAKNCLQRNARNAAVKRAHELRIERRNEIKRTND